MECPPSPSKSRPLPPAEKAEGPPPSPSPPYPFTPEVQVTEGVKATKKIKGLTGLLQSCSMRPGCPYPFIKGRKIKPVCPGLSRNVGRLFRKKAQRNYFKAPSFENFIDFKKQKAKAKFVIKNSKKQSWKTYVSSLNLNTSSKTVWKKIRKIKSSCHLKKDGQIISDPTDYADYLAETYSKNSSSKNNSKNFQQTKQRAEKQNLNLSSENNEPYNNPFIMAELKSSVDKSIESAAGPDGVYYQFLRHLPESCLHTLLKLFNNIWTTGDIPPSWREASVVPIPKPGKDPSDPSNKDPSDPSNYRPIAPTSCLFRSKLDYGSVIYGCVKKHVLRALDPIHHQGLRIALVASRTTPIKSLYIEAGEPSLEHRRIKLAFNYVLKLKSLPRNPCHDVVFEAPLSDFSADTKSEPNLVANTFEHIKNANISLNIIDSLNVQSFPPWEEHNINVAISLTKQNKENTSEVAYQKDSFRIKDKFSNHYAVFTDGSKLEEKVAAAAYFPEHPDRSKATRLRDGASAFSAELEGIALALTEI
ncbi:RNA-directed DNA polymerase from mobile element jockey [Plakobranchus ocellatus]|uniref:RNA-directed DNA polymerase from mobile element jockey n=1 Tax=Plakobranchus ocellatus TaxID=259542 RepID=A0AAV4CN29_9GAST|nr:RNA-directed DNA polymerase from mobile element jockey [Plakobranchus ocellatus]